MGKYLIYLFASLLIFTIAKNCNGYSSKALKLGYNLMQSKLFLNRILVDYNECNKDISSDTLTVSLPIDDERVLHIQNILKLTVNDKVRMGIVNHGLTDGVLTSINDSYNISLGLYDKLIKILDTPCVDLILAVPRPLRLERMIPIIASLGIRRLYLIAANKVEKDYFGSHLFRRPKELNKLLLEGLSQASNNYILPEIHIRKNFQKFIKDELPILFEENSNRFIAHPYSIDNMNSTVKRLFDYDKDIRTKCAVIAIGPEGGWEDEEVTSFLKHDFQQITLGNHILRTDVAVTVTLGMINEWLHVK